MVRIVVISMLSLFVFSLTLAQSQSLTLVTHDSFNVSEDILARFEDDTGIDVEILRLGDAGTMVNQSILTKENPLGDVMFGIDNTFLGRALDNDLFIPYESSLLEQVDEEFRLDLEMRVTPIDYGDVCLNYDIAYFEDHELPVPDNLIDLIDPAYTGLLVVQNPAASSPGLAFLLTTIAAFGTEGNYTYLDFWSDLVANDVLVANDWSDAYFTHFTMGGGDGARPLVVSYASSPPFTIDPESGEALTRSIVADGMCFRQIEFAGILSGSQKVEQAQQFIDFMLSLPFQEDMPLQMFVFPVNREATLPPEFEQFALIPEDPVDVDPAELDAQRQEWIQAWTEIVLR